MPPVSLADARPPFVLAIDAGTSSVRAQAFDREGRAVGETEAQLRYELDTTPDGGASCAPDLLFDLTVRALDGAVARLGARATEVAAVGTTSFWHSLLGIGEDGAPTTPVYYWADTRAAGDAAALRAELDAGAILQRTGCRLHSSYWPAKLRWLGRTDAEMFRRTARWCSFAEYALGRMCNADAGAVTICMASGTGLLDVHTLRWDQQILAACGIDESRLSPLVDLGPPGRLGPEFARRWRALAGVPWFPALGDGACANVGSGAIGPSRLALTVGTSAAMRLILPRAPGSDWTVPEGLWAYRLDRRRAVLGGALSNGGNLLRWIWDTTGTGPDDAATVAAGELAPDSTGLTILPFLAGERSPGWHDDATGVFAGLTLATPPAHLIRAGMEGVAYRLAGVYDALRPLADDEHEVVVSGGALLGNRAWLQITADTLGHALSAMAAGDESTSRGAALMAAVEAGLATDLAAAFASVRAEATVAEYPANHETYRAGRGRQERLERALLATGEFI